MIKCNFLAPSECENYYTFDQDDRNENSDETGWFCDSSEKHTSKDWHGEGWYRFTGKSGELLPVVPGPYHLNALYSKGKGGSGN